MLGLPLAFATPWALLALLALPIIWWLLRLTPPKPTEEIFPPTRILEQLGKKEETPKHSPWWLTLLRLTMAALVVLAMAVPVWNPQEPVVKGEGPILLVIDNSWAAGPSWRAQLDAANRIIDQADDEDRSISLIFAAGDPGNSLVAAAPRDAAKSLKAAKPQPLESNWSAANALVAKLPPAAKPTSIAWLSAGPARNSELLATALGQLGAEEYSLYLPVLDEFAVLGKAINDPAAMEVTIRRPLSSAAQSGAIRAFDEKGRPLATASFNFAAGENDTIARFEFPVELRNDFARMEIVNGRSAAGVFLLDERYQRRRVGLVSGEKSDLAQPLLSPLYYISRALGPYSELRFPESAGVATAIASVIEDRVSAIVLADVGTISAIAKEQLGKWIDNGGMLIRFAGPKLAASADDDLVPVAFRRGERNLGGSLTWGTPQPLTSFNPQSPFASLRIPDDVTVTRQVLAEPSAELPQSTWASLADGTPLVTAAKRGKGWIVLFHVTANTSWSNLALSGTFVDMLRTLVSLSSGVGPDANGEKSGEQILQPYRILDGFGQMSAPPQNARPLVIQKGKRPPVSYDNPPGLYGTSDGFVAQNLQIDQAGLKPVDVNLLPGNPELRSYITEKPFDLGPWLLAAALLLLALDGLAVLWMAGKLNRRQFKPGLAVIAFSLLIAFPTNTLVAQENKPLPEGFEATLTTRLAYVVTGISSVDEISRQGMIGLTDFIASRTSLEPGEPVGVDIANDELSFFPMLYWPIDPAAASPTAGTMARIDAFMKKGGTVIFDTKDALSGGFGGNQTSQATLRLREILTGLDIPPLERVPADHVLTKAFYLLNNFPGRYNSDDFWVETSEPEENDGRPVRIGDGVSTIIITSNDLAGAWAVDNEGRPLLPTVPPNPNQRVYAYRVGVNLIMYTLTGNYKSDQVHIPALLERLGQ